MADIRQVETLGAKRAEKPFLEKGEQPAVTRRRFHLPEKTFLWMDRVLVFYLGCLIFCLPFAKAGIEVFAWNGFFLFLMKRCLGYRSGEAAGGLLPLTPLNKALGLLMAANILSVVFSVNHALSLRGLFGKEFKFFAVFFMLAEVINSKARLKFVLYMAMASAFLISGDAVVQYIKGHDFMMAQYIEYRLTGPFSSASGFAGWLNIVLFLFFGLLARADLVNKFNKALLFLATLVLTFCLLFSYSRGGWVGFILGLLLMALCLIRIRIPVPAMKRFCASFALGLGVLLVLMPAFKKMASPAVDKPSGLAISVSDQLLASISAGEEIPSLNNGLSAMSQISHQSNAERLKLWQEALRIASDYPLFGSGLNTYTIVAKRYKSFDHGGVYPHNSFLQMLAEKGIIGTGVFLGVLMVFFSAALKHVRSKKDSLVLGLMCGILAFLVQSFFDTHLFSLQQVVLFWFALGLAVAALKLSPASVPAQKARP
ncbi:MAG: O-antigen ligase family protein [Candidatus Omnitrophota bacterium]